MAFGLRLRHVPITMEVTSNRMIGTSNLRRLEFGVGQGDWRSTEWLDDAVRVEFDLALRAAR